MQAYLFNERIKVQITAVLFKLKCAELHTLLFSFFVHSIISEDQNLKIYAIVANAKTMVATKDKTILKSQQSCSTATNTVFIYLLALAAIKHASRTINQLFTFVLMRS